MKEVLEDAEKRMKKSIAVLSSDYKSIRAGRANPAVLDKIRVNYYGAPTPINQLAAVSVSEARVLTIQPWDMSISREVVKAIETSDLGINPQFDGKIIRLSFPPLSEERRRDLVKEISKMCEDCKVSVRSIRRDTMEKRRLRI
jgi:ribosome recycling factor